MPDSFSELPDALVRDLLAIAGPVAEQVARDLGKLVRAREPVRANAQHAGLIKRKADLDVTREPSVVGIDGSYQLHRLAALDLCAAASVAVEGSSKEARRFWQEPYHHMWVQGVEHSKDATNALRGLMISMEVALASNAPHDVVMLDGSFIVLLIYLNQGLNAFRRAPAALTTAFMDWWTAGTLDRFLALLESERTIAVPKYSSRNELVPMAAGLDIPTTDGKTLATMILEPDEYMGPLAIFNFDGEDDEYHLPREFCPEETQDRMNRSIEALRVVFYRPYGWSPAVRLEVPGVIASSRARLALALEAIRTQFFSPAVLEPYPLFLADRMVKSLGSGVQVIEQAVAQHAAATSDNVEGVLMHLQNYRTEGGRAS